MSSPLVCHHRARFRYSLYSQRSDPPRAKTRLSVRVPTVQHVWYYGWLSALSTGVGTIPLFLWSTPSNAWMGISNAIAAGMMLSASFSLVEEGSKLEPDGTILFGHQVLVCFSCIPLTWCMCRASRVVASN